MDLPFSKNFRQRHPQLTRGLGRRRHLLTAFVVGLAYCELGARVPRGRVSIGRRARAVPAPPDLEAVRRRRPVHRRARARAPHPAQDRPDPAARPQRLRHRSRTSASTGTPASTWLRVPGALLTDIKSPQLRRRLLDHHDAARAKHLPRAAHARQVARAQAEGDQGRARHRGEVLEGQDPRALPEPDRARQRRLRHRDGRAALLRQVGARPQPRRGGHARRPAQGARALQPAPLPRARHPAPQHRASRSCARRAASATRTRASPRPIRSSSRAARRRATSRRTSSSGSASSSSSSSASGCTSRGSRSTRRSTSTCSPPPSARWRISSARSRRDASARTRTARTRRTWRAPRSAPASRRRRNSPYLQGAFVAMDPRTGAVRALVGGRDFDDSKFNRATQALRQPGSTFKPIVYADGRAERPAADVHRRRLAGLGAAVRRRQLDAAELRREVRGADDMRRGLYQSRNIVAIKVGMELGPSERHRDGAQVRHHDADPALSVDLHRRRRRLSDRDGRRLLARSPRSARARRRTAIVRVENSKGDVLWEPTPERTPVMSPEEAWLMVSMMKDVVQRGTAAGSVGSQFRIPAGGKTGTTNDGADVWFIGYTSDLVAGVWMGLDKPKKIKGNAQGGVLAAPAWTAFMREVYRRKPASPDWPRPEGIVERQIDLRQRACSGRPAAARRSSDYFLAGTDPIATCIPPAETYPTTPGMPGEPSTSPVDTSFGFPRAAAAPPAPRPDTSALSRIRSSRWQHRHAGRRPDPARVAPASDARLRRRSVRHPSAARAPRGTRRRARRLHATRATRSRFPRRSADDLAARRLPRPLHALRRRAQRGRRRGAGRARSACVRASPTTSRATRPRRSTRRAPSRAISTTSSEYDVLRGGEFCWHDALWRELPPRRPCAASRTASARCTPFASPSGDFFRVFHRDLPSGLTPAAYIEAHVSSLEALAGEMPVDVFAHPTLDLAVAASARSARALERGARGALVRALCAAGIAFEISNRYRPHERIVRRAAEAGVRLSLGSDGHSREQVADVGASARARARRRRARRGAVRSRRATAPAPAPSTNDALPRALGRSRFRAADRVTARWWSARDASRASGRATTRPPRERRRRRRPRRRDPAAGARQRALPSRAHGDARLPRRPRRSANGSCG